MKYNRTEVELIVKVMQLFKGQAESTIATVMTYLYNEHAHLLGDSLLEDPPMPDVVLAKRLKVPRGKSNE
jgi:hypothetical protein